MIDEPTPRGRGVVQIAATAANALLGSALVLLGAALAATITFTALDIAPETWSSLGASLTSALGEDLASLLATFQIDLGTLLAEAARSNNLPEFGLLVRQALSLLLVVALAIALAGAAPLLVARAIWRRDLGRSVRLYGALLVTSGVLGIAINGAPQIFWGLTVGIGALSLVATVRRRAKR